MSRPHYAVWLLALVAVVALFVYGYVNTSPEPFAIPPTMPLLTPVDARHAPQEVNVMNFPTVSTTTPDRPYMTPTAAFPDCPSRSGTTCQVAVPVHIVTPPTMIVCNSANLATMNAGLICVWQDATP